MSGETRLEQFLLLAKGSKGLATAKVVQQAIEEPGLFVFGELLDLSSVQELAGTEHAPSLSLLRLFAYGTWPDYHSQKAQEQLPELTTRQESKLRQLTVASAARDTKIIPYQALKQGLGLHEERELEDFLITSCIYAGLVSGKLDPGKQCLRTHSAVARDVRRQDLGPVLAGFQGWLVRVQDTAAMLETQIAHAKQTAATNAQMQAVLKEKAEEVKKTIKVDDAPGSSLPAGSEPEPMDLLDEERVPPTRMKRRR